MVTDDPLLGVTARLLHTGVVHMAGTDVQRCCLCMLEWNKTHAGDEVRHSAGSYMKAVASGFRACSPHLLDVMEVTES